MLERLQCARRPKSTFVLLRSDSPADNTGMRRLCRQYPPRRWLPILRCLRAGLSLLEVLLAFVFLTCALAATGQRLFVGVNSANRLQQETEAGLRCETILGMLLSGAQRYQASGTYADDHRWRWRADLTPSSVSGMMQLTVSVWHTDPERRFATCSFTRLVRAGFPDVAAQGEVMSDEGWPR